MNGLKPKQRKFIEAFKSGLFRYLCAAGSAGSGKSFVTLGLLHILCCNIRNLRFAVIRKSEKNLKQTTIPSYNQMKKKTKSEGDSVIVDLVARYKNGSEILFVWADISKDPDLDNIKGLELTGALIEEANQIDKKYFDLLKTRVGRWNNDKCKSFIMLNLNPSLGWVKSLFYEPWIDGTLEEPYYFEEFSIEDNDSLEADYIKGLLDLPAEERKRYVENRWDYTDIPNQLVQYAWYKQCLLDQYHIKKTDRAMQAIDPAWEGNDDTVFGRMHGNHIGWWESYPKQDPDVSGILAHEKAKTYNIDSSDTIIDTIGLGAATWLKMHNDLKYTATKFIAGATATFTDHFITFQNIRSEAAWLVAESLRNQEVTLEHHIALQRQVLAIKYKIDDKKYAILPKKDTKKEIHESPGHFDVLQMLVHRYKTTTSGLSQELFGRQLQRQQGPIGTTRAAIDRIRRIKANRLGIGSF